MPVSVSGCRSCRYMRLCQPRLPPPEFSCYICLLTFTGLHFEIQVLNSHSQEVERGLFLKQHPNIAHVQTFMVASDTVTAGATVYKKKKKSLNKLASASYD